MKKIEWYHALVAFGLFLILSNVLGYFILGVAMNIQGIPLSESMDFQFTKLGLGLSSITMFISFMAIPILYVMLLKKPLKLANPKELLADVLPLNTNTLLITVLGMFAFGYLIEGIFSYILEAYPNFNKSILGLINERFYTIFGDLDFHRKLYEIFNTDNFLIFLMLIVFVGVLPGIGEEFFFRGFMQRVLLNKMNFFWAVVFSGGLFGLIHSIQDMSQAVGAFLISFYLGYIYYKTKNLWVPIIAHILNNSFMGTMAYLFPDMMMESSEPSFSPIIISIPLCLFVIYYLKNLNDDESEDRVPHIDQQGNS